MPSKRWSYACVPRRRSSTISQAGFHSSLPSPHSSLALPLMTVLAQAHLVGRQVFVPTSTFSSLAVSSRVTRTQALPSLLWHHLGLQQTFAILRICIFPLISALPV